MKAIICNANDRLVWAEVPNPIIKPGDALIEIHAAAINRADLLQRAGQYPPPAGWPEWFGLEVAGVIVALGAEAQAQDEWHIGDQVCALLGGGGYAEYVACPTEMLMPIPKGVSMQEAAALPEAFGAAYLFLFYEARLRAGDTVLMQAGASGLASVVIPMARAFGARVLTTVLNEKVAESIVHLKADRVIDTSREDLAEVIMSSHIQRARRCDEVVQQMLAIEKRGCDIAKIVTVADTEDEFVDAIKTTLALRRTLKVPFIHLCSGAFARPQRLLGPTLGSMLTFCVQRYSSDYISVQPPVVNMLAALKNLNWSIDEVV